MHGLPIVRALNQRMSSGMRQGNLPSFLARKPFDFYDRWTAQYPQNNLSTMQAAMAYLKLYHLTKNPTYPETGREAVDYLLLTQQVWNHPLLSPRLVGGCARRARN